MSINSCFSLKSHEDLFTTFLFYIKIYLKLKKITFFTGCAFLTYFSPESSTTAENSPTAGTQGTLYNDKQSITGVSAHLYKHTYSYIYRLH